MASGVKVSWIWRTVAIVNDRASREMEVPSCGVQLARKVVIASKHTLGGPCHWCAPALTKIERSDRQVAEIGPHRTDRIGHSHMHTTVENATRIGYPDFAIDGVARSEQAARQIEFEVGLPSALNARLAVALLLFSSASLN